MHKEMSDREIEKLIVVTQSKDRSGRLDASLAKLIDDGLAMYEQELAEVGGTRLRLCTDRIVLVKGMAAGI